ncbi:UFD1-domain-containing protein [Basidiobolus meristosporus CBS 931.73]|uniref:UFD1-domain-containing protein n=1 Tax=Basidiobolus meristosporus CBS 931.73 TaxID=1314790 RepID=A0A1Y1ZCE8_9FUNG|nr:UFD1-domain-containing protein [Basidiobolus meristosporus CBS 931.73]|eukprot:ORY07475.1 UFD1-domain-containing protein [Basidiobolus meristosporus CBS 931.73]
MTHPTWNSRLRIIANPSLNDGDKLILPPSSLESLMNQLHSNQTTPNPSTQHTSPFTFRLLNEKKKIITHAGVREFTAEEGTVELPEWLASSLDMKDGEGVIITAQSLPKGTWGRMRPLTQGYKKIPDFRSAFEANFRAKFTTLTAGEVISIKYGAQLYQFLIEALKPADAVDIVDTDLELEILPMNEDGISIDSGTIPKTQPGDSGRELTIGGKAAGQINHGEHQYWKIRAHPSSGVHFRLSIFKGDAGKLREQWDAMCFDTDSSV